MLRILIAAIVLLVAAWFYLDQGDESTRPLETQQQALDKAKEVEQIVQQQAKDMQEQIDRQTGDGDDDGSRT